MKLQRKPVQSEVHIPVDLAFLVIERQLLAPFQLYIFLKTHSFGIVEKDPHFNTFIAQELRVSPNTIKNWVEKLLQFDWIGFDPISKLFYVRGFKVICSIEKIKSKRAAAFSTANMNKLKGFMCALPYAHFALYNNKERGQRRAVHLMGNTFQLAQDLSTFTPVAISVISNHIEISAYKAYSIRKVAENEGFLIIKPNIKELTSSNLYDFSKLRHYDASSILKNIFYKNGKLYKRFPDLVWSPIKFLKR